MQDLERKNPGRGAKVPRPNAKRNANQQRAKPLGLGMQTSTTCSETPPLRPGAASPLTTRPASAFC